MKAQLKKLKANNNLIHIWISFFELFVHVSLNLFYLYFNVRMNSTQVKLFK